MENTYSYIFVIALSLTIYSFVKKQVINNMNVNECMLTNYKH